MTNENRTQKAMRPLLDVRAVLLHHPEESQRRQAKREVEEPSAIRRPAARISPTYALCSVLDATAAEPARSWGGYPTAAPR